MEIFVLCLLAILIAHYTKMRSKIIYRAHGLLFVCYFIFSLFTLKLPVTTFLMNLAFGEELFAQISAIIKMPFGWAYSAGAVVGIVELIYICVVTLIAAITAVNKIRGIIHNKFCHKLKTNEFGAHTPVKNTFAERKIFLIYCRLLN